MNIVAWARVSSREQREGYSIDAQLRAMRDRASKSGWTIVREFAVAESAKRGADRAAFNEMLAWVKANTRREGIGAILSHKLDRACRNMRDAVRLQELEDHCGVKLVFVENQFGPGAAGSLSFNVMAAVAQYYSDNLRSEVLKGIDEKIRQGWPTGQAPYGYRLTGDSTEPVAPHDERGRTVARMFELYAGGRHSFKSLGDQLQREGYRYNENQPGFKRTTLSHVLGNRFYVGELHRNGQVFAGKYRLLIDRTTFEACQDVLHGRNRRIDNPDLAYSGCLLRCGCCGYAITGERIRKKLKDGGFNTHIYYCCGNGHKADDHPRVRWREADVDAAIVRELDAIRLPTPKIAAWFRAALEATFNDVSQTRATQQRTLAKRRSEATNMQQRLLNGYLNGVIDEGVFAEKSADLKRQGEDIDRQLDEADGFDSATGQTAMAVFDFSQNLAALWQGSKSGVRRDILECVTLNRTLTSASLALEKRKPFDFLAERPFLTESWGTRIRT
jgi:site-specific DNA recombinase